MSNEIREELERQYERAAKNALEHKKNKITKNSGAMIEARGDQEEKYLIAPRSFKKEFAEQFKSLSPEMRKYLHERESEIERGFSRLNNELNRHQWLDEFYADRSERLGKLGIKQAKDWVETMAKIDDSLETNPAETLHILAKAYDVSLDPVASPTEDLLKLQECLNELSQKFDCFVSEYKAQAKDAMQIAESKKAHEASFALKGKNPTKDLSKLSTREVLEMKMAEYDN